MNPSASAAASREACSASRIAATSLKPRLASSRALRTDRSPAARILPRDASHSATVLPRILPSTAVAASRSTSAWLPVAMANWKARLASSLVSPNLATASVSAARASSKRFSVVKLTTRFALKELERGVERNRRPIEIDGAIEPAGLGFSGTEVVERRGIARIGLPPLFVGGARLDRLEAHVQVVAALDVEPLALAGALAQLESARAVRD